MKNLNLPITPFAVLQLAMEKLCPGEHHKAYAESLEKENMIINIMTYTEIENAIELRYTSTVDGSTDICTITPYTDPSECTSQPWVVKAITVIESIIDISCEEYLSMFLTEDKYYDGGFVAMQKLGIGLMLFIGQMSYFVNKDDVHVVAFHGESRPSVIENDPHQLSFKIGKNIDLWDIADTTETIRKLGNTLIEKAYLNGIGGLNGRVSRYLAFWYHNYFNMTDNKGGVYLDDLYGTKLIIDANSKTVTIHHGEHHYIVHSFTAQGECIASDINEQERNKKRNEGDFYLRFFTLEMIDYQFLNAVLYLHTKIVDNYKPLETT